MSISTATGRGPASAQQSAKLMNGAEILVKCLELEGADTIFAYPGGANEHWNQEAGQVWLERAREQWTSNLWINPIPEKYWGHTHSIKMIREIFEDRMVPMTLRGPEEGMKELTR